MLLQLTDVNKIYNGAPLLKHISLTIEDRDRIGLIGVNGCGKSTLLKLITERILPDHIQEGDGEIIKSSHTSIGYLEQMGGLEKEQTVWHEMHNVFQPLLDAQARMRELEQELADNSEAAAEEYHRLQTYFESNDGYQIDVKIKMVLNGMGFGAETYERKISSFSGGEKTRLAIAKLLLEEPTLLILDEPTNHLDMRSKDVLKEAIREFDGTVILVSHDRDFLDGLATKVYEFGGGLVKEHLGGIYEFLQKKKIDSLNELQKGAGLSASPTASAKGNEPETVQPSENKLSYEAQKELNKKIKKLERQVADCEASIEETESAIAIVEAKMATPEGASDMQLYERHQKLKQQLDGIVEEWERVSMELEEVKN